MKKLLIYKLALNELYRRREKEEKLFAEAPNNRPIAKNWIRKYKKYEKELNDLILTEEKEIKHDEGTKRT